jgi:hypothetical protein
MAQQGIYRNASVVTARPVVPGPIAEYTQPYSLTTGSQINEAAEYGAYEAAPLTSGSSLDKAQKGAPWPGIINGAVKFFNSWRPNALREIANHNVAGNYGSETGRANFGWRHFEFEAFYGPNGKLAGYPNTGGPNPHVPEWNNLVPIIYGLRVLNPASAGQTGLFTSVPQTVASQFTTPTQFTPTGTAALAARGVTLQ